MMIDRVKRNSSNDRGRDRDRGSRDKDRGRDKGGSRDRGGDKGKGRRYQGYQQRSAQSIGERANRKTAGFETIFKNSVDRFSYEKGDNPMRICPPTFDGNPNNHYFLQVWVHPRQGSDNSDYVCLAKNKWIGKPCAFCDAEKEAREDKEDDESKRLKAVEQWVGWILPREADEPDKPHAFKMSFTQDRDLASLCQGRKGNIRLIDDPDTGFDICIRRNGSGLNTKYLISVDPDSSPMLESSKKQKDVLDWLADNPINEALEVKSYEYMEQIIRGVVEEKDEDLDDDDSDNKRRGGRSRDEEDNEDREARSSKKRGRGRDDDDDDATDDDDKRGRGKSRRNDPEDDDATDDDANDDSTSDDDTGDDDTSDDDDASDGDDTGDDDTGDDDDKGSRRRPSSKGRRGSNDDDDGDDDRPTRRRSGGRGRSRDDDDDSGDDDKPTRPKSARRR